MFIREGFCSSFFVQNSQNTKICKIIVNKSVYYRKKPYLCIKKINY